MALERPVARNQGSPSGQKEAVLLGRLNLAYGNSMNKCDEKHGSFEKRANGAAASPLASGCCRIKAYRRRGSRPDENRT